MVLGLLAFGPGCRKGEHRAPEAPTSAPAPAPAQPVSLEACVDRWLNAQKLDAYGHPEGTMYAGGTPLFDEQTGERTDRLTYVFGRHPEAREACGPAIDAGSVVR